MPKYKNSFRSPEFIEEVILDESDNVIGTIRLKPSSILWKPKGKHYFQSVPIPKFIDWIGDPLTKARKTKQ